MARVTKESLEAKIKKAEGRVVKTGVCRIGLSYSF